MKSRFCCEHTIILKCIRVRNTGMNGTVNQHSKISSNKTFCFLCNILEVKIRELLDIRIQFIFYYGTQHFTSLLLKNRIVQQVHFHFSVYVDFRSSENNYIWVTKISFTILDITKSSNNKIWADMNMNKSQFFSWTSIKSPVLWLQMFTLAVILNLTTIMKQPPAPQILVFYYTHCFCFTGKQKSFPLRWYMQIILNVKTTALDKIHLIIWYLLRSWLFHWHLLLIHVLVLKKCRLARSGRNLHCI